MYKLHTEETIEIAHRLVDHHGKCSNLHGHSVKVEVEIWSSKLNEMGMVIDFGDIKDAIKVFDHKYINEEFNSDSVYAKNPTAERLAHLFCKRINEMDFFSKVTVRVHETAKNYAEFTIEEGQQC
jgi:6-pyruvoyltetrahydropterin/6-carboxytetrahydropterin synthase